MSVVEPDELPPPARATDPSEARPFQYSLKTLLGATTAACIVFAAIAQLSAVWGVIFLFVLLLVAAHVTANAMGTRAAARTTERILRGEDKPNDATAGDARAAAAPTTRLGANDGLGLPLLALVGCGAVVGSVLGTIVVWLHNDRQVAAPAMILACFSSAGIGAFLTFLTAGCARAASRAWREAARRK